MRVVICLQVLLADRGKNYFRKLLNIHADDEFKKSEIHFANC
jgi:hypothetical protein